MDPVIVQLNIDAGESETVSMGTVGEYLHYLDLIYGGLNEHLEPSSEPEDKGSTYQNHLTYFEKSISSSESAGGTGEIVDEIYEENTQRGLRLVGDSILGDFMKSKAYREMMKNGGTSGPSVDIRRFNRSNPIELLIGGNMILLLTILACTKFRFSRTKMRKTSSGDEEVNQQEETVELTIELSQINSVVESLRPGMGG